MSDEHTGRQNATGRGWQSEGGVKQRLTCDRQQLGCTRRATLAPPACPAVWPGMEIC
jgi:hypothetical protein